jgi:hypothetical protein
VAPRHGCELGAVGGPDGEGGGENCIHLFNTAWRRAHPHLALSRPMARAMGSATMATKSPRPRIPAGAVTPPGAGSDAWCAEGVPQSCCPQRRMWHDSHGSLTSGRGLHGVGQSWQMSARTWATPGLMVPPRARGTRRNRRTRARWPRW